MPLNCKKVMISARLPEGLVTRMDFVVRNITSELVTNRSSALQACVEAWLISQEKELTDLGVIPGKTR